MSSDVLPYEATRHLLASETRYPSELKRASFNAAYLVSYITFYLLRLLSVLPHISSQHNYLSTRAIVFHCPMGLDDLI